MVDCIVPYGTLASLIWMDRQARLPPVELGAKSCSSSCPRLQVVPPTFFPCVTGKGRPPLGQSSTAKRRLSRDAATKMAEQRPSALDLAREHDKGEPEEQSIRCNGCPANEACRQLGMDRASAHEGHAPRHERCARRRLSGRASCPRSDCGHAGPVQRLRKARPRHRMARGGTLRARIAGPPSFRSRPLLRIGMVGAPPRSMTALWPRRVSWASSG